MKILVDYQLNTCVATISGDATLPELAFSIESIISYFLGRGVSRFECIKTKKDGYCVLSFRALKKSGPMALSKVASIATAIQSGLFPTHIHKDQKFQVEEEGFQEFVKDGQNKHASLIVGTKKEDNLTCSVIESFKLVPDLPMTILSYGLSDMFTGLMALGCNYIKWQGSANLVQLYIKHNLKDEELRQFLLSKVDYNIEQKVSTII